MAVIAMTREMGSLGRDVALGLAEELNLTLVQHEVIDHVAEKMHLGNSTVNRFLEGKAGLLERWGIDEKRASLYTAEEIFELASQDNILIRGWGATYLLRPVSHVACVRICAPIAKRAQELMMRIGLTDQQVAIKEIEKNDTAHGKTMMNLFHANWQEPLLYDLVLNTARIPVSDCIFLIKQLVSQPAFQPTPESRKQLTHLKLQAQIRAALKSNPKTERLDALFDIELDSEQGHVVISGMVDDDAISVEAERTIKAVPSVNSVENQLLIATHLRYGP